MLFTFCKKLNVNDKSFQHNTPASNCLCLVEGRGNNASSQPSMDDVAEPSNNEDVEYLQSCLEEINERVKAACHLLSLQQWL